MEVDPEIENILSKRFDVKFSEKLNKTETGSLNFSYYDIIIQSKAPDGKIKINKSIAYPEISSILIKDNENIVLDLSEKGSQVNIQMENPLYLLKCVYTAFKIFFPCEDIFTFFTVNSEKLSIESVKEEVRKISIVPQSPCNNFTYGIKFFAKYSYLNENEEIIWDIDTVYANKDSKMFCLKDFDHLKSKYLFPVLGAMCYNTYFNELCLNNVDLSSYEKTLERVFKYNKRFKKLYFVNCNLKISICSTIALGMDGQKNLICLDLSCNDGIGDKGLDYFIPFLKKSSQYLEVFKMSRCNLNTLSICKIADAFTYNIRGDDYPIQLRILDLSCNTLKEGFKDIFYEFLSKCCYLEDLNLSSMNSSIEEIPICLLKGPINTLKYLNLSENISSSIQTCTHWSAFFKNVVSLVQINLSNFKFLSCSITDGLLYGLPENSTLSLSGFEVLISNSSFTGNYLNRFVDFISKIKFITHLDLSCNGLDVEGSNIFRYLPELSSLKSLNMSSNFINTKPKDQQTIIMCLTNALQLENVNLQELYIANCNFGTSLSTFISELDCLFSLQILDISGNNIGNVLARTLGRLLTIDKHLREIIMDNNNISKEIYEEILDGLEKNFTLTTFHVPIVDLIKYPPKLIVPIIEKINKHHIKVNKIFQGISFEDVKAMAFSCMMNQTTENIDKCKIALQESCNRLKSVNPSDKQLTLTINKSLEKSFEVINTVDKSKDLLSKLNGVYKNNSTKPNLSTDIRIKNVIDKVCGNISGQLNEYMDEITQELTTEISNTLPSLCNGNNNNIQGELTNICKKSLIISNDYIKKLFERFIEQNLIKKVYETEINVTNLLCDRITDEVISQMNLCDIQANKLFALSKSCNNNSKPSSPTALSEESFEFPSIRKSEEKRDRTNRETVRNSRMSYLSANKSRPISKAIKVNMMDLEIAEIPEVKGNQQPIVPGRTKRSIANKPEILIKTTVPENDLLTSLKERPKPRKSIKPKVTSPTTPTIEHPASISDESWKNFYPPENADLIKPVDNTSKKKKFFGRTKDKKNKPVDFNDLGKEDGSSSDIDIDKSRKSPEGQMKNKKNL